MQKSMRNTEIKRYGITNVIINITSFIKFFHTFALFIAVIYNTEIFMNRLAKDLFPVEMNDHP